MKQYDRIYCKSFEKDHMEVTKFTSAEGLVGQVRIWEDQRPSSINMSKETMEKLIKQLQVCLEG